MFRVLQGMFGAALVPLSQSVMYDIYPPEQRAKAMGLWTMGVMIGPICGPILGGWLTDNYSWRWVFYINVPFGIVTAIGLLTFLKETPRSGISQARLDRLRRAEPGHRLVADDARPRRDAGLVQFARDHCGSRCGGDRLLCLPGAVLPGAAAVPVAASCSPIRISPSALVLYAIMGLIMYASLALLAPYLQTLMNYPVVTAGIVLAPRGAGLMLAALICGRVMGKISARLLVGHRLRRRRLCAARDDAMDARHFGMRR